MMVQKPTRDSVGVCKLPWEQSQWASHDVRDESSTETEQEAKQKLSRKEGGHTIRLPLQVEQTQKVS